LAEIIKFLRHVLDPPKKKMKNGMKKKWKKAKKLVGNNDKSKFIRGVKDKCFQMRFNFAKSL